MIDTATENKGEAFYEEILKVIKDNNPYNLITIYDSIKDFTPVTNFIKISEEETLAIADCYRSLESKTVELTKKQAAYIRQIEQKVEALINEKFKGKAFFAKLYQRSFKDGRSYHKINHMETYEKEFEILRSKWRTSKWRTFLSEEDWEKNLRVIAAETMIYKNLKCTSTKEIMNLMVTSTKTYLDLEVLLEHSFRCKEQGKENDFFDNYLCIREWVDVSVVNEYRCLIYKNNFISMSQYASEFYDHLATEEQCEDIKNKVVTFWKEKVKEPLSSLVTYNVDIAIVKDGTLLVIELNSLAYCDPFFMKEEKEKVLKGEIDISDWNDNKIKFKTNDKLGEYKLDLLKEELKLSHKDEVQHETYDAMLQKVESKRSCFIY
jgi:hypothetical protein